MPFFPLHTFTSLAGTTYTIWYDVDTNTLDTTWDLDSEVAVTEEELGVPVGTILYQECEGFTLIQIIAKTEFPFADKLQTVNSEACGYSPEPTGTCSYGANP